MTVAEEPTLGQSTLSLAESALPRKMAPEKGRLSVVYPPKLARIISLTERALVLGRSPQSANAVSFPESSVSRSHLEITWDASCGRHCVFDAGSRNGTWLNAERLANKPEFLEDNTVIRMADILMVYERETPGEGWQSSGESTILGQSLAAVALRSRIARFSLDPSPILLIGDTGTGKEVVANEIHGQSGRSGPFLAVNCAALSAQLIDSQLFGHIKGAFTGAEGNQQGLFRAADGGSLLLDEVGELPLESQAKLLRVIQEREVMPVGASQTSKVDVRLIAATNCDLANMVEDGRFRRDLYARLCPLEIRVPPLTKRRADILGWIERLDARWCEERSLLNPRPFRFESKAAEAVLASPWPENLRGVERLVHHLGLGLDREAIVSVDQLPDWLFSVGGGASSPSTDSAQVSNRSVPTRDELVRVLDSVDWNVAQVARHFDRHRKQVYRWMSNLGIQREPTG